MALKYRAIEVIARRFQFFEASGGRLMEHEILHAKWLVWHGKYRKAWLRGNATVNIHDLPATIFVRLGKKPHEHQRQVLPRRFAGPDGVQT